MTFCKNLIITQLDSPHDLEWITSENKIRRPEFAQIILTYQSQFTGEAPQQATCYYEYNTVEENVMNQVDPLSAYATVPYKMIMHEEELTEQELYKAIQVAALKQGKDVVERVQKEITAKAQQIKNELTQ